ncbi:MAG: alanine--tRNA ligase [Deltaproteobacteria bacterium]|nr:alanine--tRNA ligase [Deltaproteobacteria bacterium]
MRSIEIRKNFLDYFSRNGHAVVPSSGLIPEGDPTLLFTNAGMVQFKKAFLGEERMPYGRAASAQKCMRAGGKHNDLENVGKTGRHHTFFEMLGNFSFGDYFKEGAIEFAWEFLTKVAGLPEEKLWVTVFRDDAEAENIWRERVHVPPGRIKRLGEKDNFWSMGDVGPCGPCSEIIIDQGEGVGCGSPACGVECDCDRFLELWNLVFMQYNRDAGGNLSGLPSPSIDTGMGLERLASVLQGKHSNYDSDLFAPIIETAEKISSVRYGEDPARDVSIRAIADHSRAIAFLLSDGLMPSNEGRGYVLRRIIRRAVRHGRFLGIKEPFLYRVCGIVPDLMGEVYPELIRSRELVSRATLGEEERFFETLEKGLGMLNSAVETLKKQKKAVIPGDVVFKLYDTYGFPSDLTADIVRDRGFTVDEEGFTALMDTQREMARGFWKGIGGKAGGEELYRTLASEGLKSRFVGYHIEAASSKVVCIIKDNRPVEKAGAGDRVEIITEETPFYGESGGQTGDTGVMSGAGVTIKVVDVKRPVGGIIVHHCLIEDGSVGFGDTLALTPDMEKRKSTCRNHTATHILHAALRKTLGGHVRQSGSMVTPEGFRFDFNHSGALTDTEMEAIEAEGNRVIRDNLEVTTRSMPQGEAVREGALAFFGEKYGSMVRVVSIDDVSMELCGGTHVRMTGDIGLMKITSDSSVASGVRRIEAVTGAPALRLLNQSDELLGECAALLRAAKAEVPDKVKRLMERQKELEREIAELKRGRKKEGAVSLLEGAREIGGVRVVSARVDPAGPEELRDLSDMLRVRLGSGIVILGSILDGKAVILAAVTQDLTTRFSAGEIVKRLSPIVGGKGGGKAALAQAGGKLAENIDEAIEKAFSAVEDMAKKR